MYQETMKELKERMEKTISAFKNDLKLIRAGRANPAILDNVTVEAYGTMSPLNQVAGITVPEARLIVIQPWDKSLLSSIEKAILKSNIGITPQSDGKVIRLPFPDLTEERRKELAKQVGDFQEKAKIAVRNARREGVDVVKKMEKNKELTEDDLYSAENEIQELTDRYIKEIDEISEEKVEELMNV